MGRGYKDLGRQHFMELRGCCTATVLVKVVARVIRILNGHIISEKKFATQLEPNLYWIFCADTDIRQVSLKM